MSNEQKARRNQSRFTLVFSFSTAWIPEKKTTSSDQLEENLVPRSCHRPGVSLKTLLGCSPLLGGSPSRGIKENTAWGTNINSN